jgi:hypothetical protein
LGPLIRVIPQRSGGGGVQRHQPGQAAFTGSDCEHAIGQIDVGAGQRKRFGDPQPGAGEQTQQRDIAEWSQPARRGQPGSRLQQICDLAVGIDVRRGAVTLWAEQARRGYLGGSVQRG